MSTPKVLLATSIGPCKQDSLAYVCPVVQAIKAQSQGTVADTLLIWNTGSPVPDVLHSQFSAVEELEIYPHPDPHRWGACAYVREYVRRIAVAGGYTHLYFHDCDVVPPFDVVPRLLARNMSVTSAIYPIRQLTEPVLPALMIDGLVGYNTMGGLPIDELMPVAGFGMGAMLIRRDALDTPFRDAEWWYDRHTPPSEDWQWSLDSGEVVWLDLTASCFHVMEDGRGSRIRRSDPLVKIVWCGFPGEMSNEYGVWRRGMVRTDLTPEQADTLKGNEGFHIESVCDVDLEWARVKVVPA